MRLLGAIFILLWAGACAPGADNWTPGNSASRQSDVVWTVSRHEVRFVPGTERLAAGEAARLGEFLGEIDLRRPAHVFVGAGARGESTQLTARRSAAAREILGRYGIAVQSDPPPAEPGLLLSPRPSGADKAVILAGRFDVHVSGCPDWRKPELDEYSNTASSNFGCASAHNLALMVADPEDLVRGREAGPSDGVRAASTVRKYRSGVLPALPDESSSSSFVAIPQAGSGGS